METGGSPDKKKRKARVGRQALYMRQYRARPEIRKREQDARRAREDAMNALAKKYPADFLVLVNEERFRYGLTSLKPRGKSNGRKPIDLSVVDEVTAERQAQCPHNEGVKKSAIGIVCVLCSKRIT